MHVNYQSVLHFNHCLVILLFEQLEIDSSLYDHKIYISSFLTETRTGGRQVSKTKERKGMKKTLLVFSQFFQLSL